MTLNIKGSKWQIKKVDAENPELESHEGLADYKLKTIYLSKNPQNCTKNNLFWHEYMHAYLYECGIRDLDCNFEHVIIENLADLLERLDPNGKLIRRL